jgi:hypothetical protein
MAVVAVQASEVRWLREWSDPAAHAHADWWPALGASRPQRALASRSGRRVLAALLRRAVPLPPLQRLPPREAVWAGAPADTLRASIERAGWLLIAPMVPRLIVRREIETVVACVGRTRYEAAFDGPVNLWRDGAAPPRLETSSVDALRRSMHALGLAAMAQALAEDAPAFIARARLLLGPSLADSSSPPAIDSAALLQQLAPEEGAAP